MSGVKLSPRARRVIAAGQVLAGDRWQTALSRASGVSQQLMSFIASGDREVTDEVDRKVAAALIAEAEKGRKAAGKLEEIAGRILQGMDIGR
ncbi:hypothetical protein V1291_003599 [Nitrobacteraceae bacterium AZCC 1564]